MSGQRPEYQVRVIDEKRELDEKLGKLGAFLSKESTLPVEQIAILTRQYAVMLSYSGILGERIAAFASVQ